MSLLQVVCEGEGDKQLLMCLLQVVCKGEVDKQS